MATNVILPLLGQTMEEGTITKWLKSEGDRVAKGEPLLEVMTDKANMEVESPVSGVLLRIVAQENATVPVKDIIAVIGEPGEDAAVAPTPTAALDEPSVPTASETPAEPLQIKHPTAQTGDGGRVFASPRARMVASEKGVDIAQLAGLGTGPGGRVVERDVIAFAEKMGAPAAPPAGIPVIPSAPAVQSPRPAVGKKIPLTPMRKSIAESVSASVRSAPHVTLVSEVDVTDVLALRRQLVDEMQRRHGVKPSFTAFVVKAAALALLDHPIVNSSLAEDGIVIHDEVNVGVAVALESGLVVPVIRRADAKPIHQIAADMEALVTKARAGHLSLEEMQGGTFTVTSLAAFGVDSFNPIINPPQSAILGVCRTVEKPVVVAGQVQVRSMMNLCLSFDHRVVDGAPAAEYLSRVAGLLQNPYLLVLER